MLVHRDSKSHLLAHAPTGLGKTLADDWQINLPLKQWVEAEDNLTAWVKLASSLEDGVETCGYFAGTQYAVIGSQEVINLLGRIEHGVFS